MMTEPEACRRRCGRRQRQQGDDRRDRTHDPSASHYCSSRQGPSLRASLAARSRPQKGATTTFHPRGTTTSITITMTIPAVGPRRLGARCSPPPSIRADEQERGGHQRQQDGPYHALAGQEEGQPHDDTDGQRQLGRVADEEVPPEVTEGLDGAGNCLHCAAFSGAGAGSCVRMKAVRVKKTTTKNP